MYAVEAADMSVTALLGCILTSYAMATDMINKL